MESCKTPVDPTIKPDPKEKDLSNIRFGSLFRSSHRWAGGQKR